MDFTEDNHPIPEHVWRRLSARLAEQCDRWAERHPEQARAIQEANREQVAGR